MNLVLAFSMRTGVRVAEVGFLLMAIAGAWLFAAQIPGLRLGGTRTGLAGALLAAGAVLLIVAVHWGHFG